MIKLNQSIFKAYDIRGVYGVDFDEALCPLLAEAVVINFSPKKVLLTRDMRVSSEVLYKILRESFLKLGVEVLAGDLATTHMMYYGALHYRADFGIQVTASHNPGKYNGFKMVKDGTWPVGDEEIISLRDRVLTLNQSLSGKVYNRGTEKKVEILNTYLDKVISLCAPDLTGLKFIMDAGNGMGSVTFAPLIEKLGGTLEKMYFELDGNFPNHEANPLKSETLVDIKQRMSGNDQYVLGLATDGDGDRVGFLTEKGEYISGDKMTALIAKGLLKDRPGTILYDLRSSWSVAEEVSAAGGRPIMCRVGHSFIKKQMREEEAIFAGELSSHYYFPELGFIESPELAFLELVKLIRREGKTLTQIVSPLSKYFSSGEINLEVDDKQAKMKALADKYGHLSEDVSWLDGIRVELADWWFNVRASNTEPLLRLNLEATNPALMSEKRDEILAFLKKGN